MLHVWIWRHTSVCGAGIALPQREIQKRSRTQRPCWRHQPLMHVRSTLGLIQGRRSGERRMAGPWVLEPRPPFSDAFVAVPDLGYSRPAMVHGLPSRPGLKWCTGACPLCPSRSHFRKATLKRTEENFSVSLLEHLVCAHESQRVTVIISLLGDFRTGVTTFTSKACLIAWSS